MTDGTTGFHVAPITEDDMNRVTSILKRAMDTMIGASQLAEDVATLRTTVNALQADADKLRNQNNALDEALNHSRQVRDDLTRQLSNVGNELTEALHQTSTLRFDNDKLTMANEQYAIDLDLTRKERDDAQFEALDLKDNLAAAEAKLAKVKELHSSLFPATEPVYDFHKPEPMPAPTSEHDDPVHIGEAVAYSYPPAEPAPEPPAPDSQDTWDPGYSWDPATREGWR